MSQSPNKSNGGNSDAASPAPQYYDLSAPLTRPVTTLQVTGFTLREGMLPSLIAPDGSLYFGPIADDGKYRIPSGCGIIFFHYDESVPSTFVQPAGSSSGSSGSNAYSNSAGADDGGSGGGFVSYFFGRGVPREAPGGSAQQQQQQRRAVGQAAAAFTALCKRYQQGDRYGGDWANGMFHGEGVLVTSYFTYQGGWKEGLMHGKGAISYTRKYVDARPAAAGAAGGANSGGGVGVGTLLLKGLSYVTPFELVATAAAPKEYFGTFEAEHGRQGAGLMRYYNGDVYEGEWQNNCRHGKGKLRKLDGEMYEGEWANDERQGYGKIMFPNGSLFKGMMQHDQRCGEGVMRFANGDEYFGNFVSDHIEGHGTMKYRNGDVYNGAWHDQLRHGNGTFTLKRTGATMTGNFQNGLIHGEATVVIPGVSTFVGTFVRGERTVGTMHWHQQPSQQTQQQAAQESKDDGNGEAAPSPNSDAPLAATAISPVTSSSAAPSPPAAGGLLKPASHAARKHYLCYQGEWHGEHMHGRGLLWYTNGDFFSGRFQKSLRHGPGNMRYAAEQAEFSGQFVYGMRHGLGLLQRADGSIRAGRWQQNSFVEGYEGEWDGTTFHGIGRLTIPLDTFFGLRAANSTLKLTDVSAILNDASSPPPPPPSATSLAGGVAGVTGEEVDGVSPTGTTPNLAAAAPAAALKSDAMRRAELAPHFIDFFGLFRNGVRDGLGMLKLPALDCLVGGSLSAAEDRRGTGKAFLPTSTSMSGAAAAAAAANSASTGGAAGNRRRPPTSSTSTPLPVDGASAGSGAVTAASGASAVPAIVIKGRWVREVLHCDKGVVAFPSGIVYIGGFSNGAREASCARVWWPDGSVMESGWRDDAPSGPGVWYQRNRVDPIFQTIIPSTLRRSRSRRITDGPTSPSRNITNGSSSAATADPPTSNTDDSASGGNDPKGNTTFAGDLFGLSYLWGLVGLGFGGHGSDAAEDAATGEDGDDEENKPRRVLIDFHSHFAIACAWHPFAMDLNTYARVVLPQIAAQTAPLANGTPWPQLMHSASMASAMSQNSAWASTASFSGSFQNASHLMTSFVAGQQQQQAPPTVRQITAGATALHLAEAPPKVSVGRANGPAVVYFDSGVVLAAEWLGNVPRLAVPYRPWSAYDSFLVWQASRPAARNCMTTFPLWVSPRSQSCYSAILAAAPDDVRGEPKRATAGGVPQHAASMAFSPLAAGAVDGAVSGGGGGGSSTGPTASESVSGVTSPDTRCTVCAKEYSFFRKRVHCTLCLRSTCTSCLGQMDTDGQRQEDVKAVLQHAYVTAEQTVQLAAAQAKANATNTTNSNGGAATRRVVFPSIAVSQAERVFESRGISTVPVCADCVRAMLWKLRYTQLWIPTSMFASVVDIERHQRDMQMRRKKSASAEAGLQGATAATEAAGQDAAAAVEMGGNDASPLAPGDDGFSYESSRQVSSGSERLPPSQINCGEAKASAEAQTPVAQRQREGDETPLGESPAPNPPSEPASASSDANPPTKSTSTTKNRYARTPQELPRPSGELLPPTQYITYSGYTSHSIPHVYGELWWGRRYYYRGGFCAGERHGFGVQYMPNGERYEGAFQRDAWHGHGVYYLEDGSVLLGEFRRGELRVVQYHGEVEEDTVNGVRPHGRGIGYDPDGSVYNGEWVHGQRHGTGMLHFPDGVSVYSGTFVAGAMEGMGKLLTTSGAYYGDFSQNQQQGKGLLFTSSCVVEGSWVHGASSGFTRIYFTDSGEVYETTYRDGNERDDCFSAPMMVEDAEAAECGQCGTAFSFFTRRHHCRLCGDVFCDACTQHRATLPANFGGDGDTGAAAVGLNAPINPNTVGQRVCDACFYRLTQRRMIGVRRYRDGSIYAGCWSQGRWVAQGLYCRPDGIYVVMDRHGHPLITADVARAKMGVSGAATGRGNNGKNSTSSATGGEKKEEEGKKTSAGVPPGGFGVSRRPARTMLPISPSILQDASPSKEVLDNVALVQESSSRKDLDGFLMWWATTRSRCGLQVPLDVLLVSKYQRMPAQLLRGGKGATVTVGSDAATYLTCPSRCTVETPHTPSLTPIRLFVTLSAARKAMQAMVEGEVRESGPTKAMEGVNAGTVGSDTTPVQAAEPPHSTPAAASEANKDSDSTLTFASSPIVSDRPGATAAATNVAPADAMSASETTVQSTSATPSSATTPLPPAAAAAAVSVSVTATPPPPASFSLTRIPTEERRTIDSDVEAAALRASRFMPVAIPRAPTVPITAATMPTTSMAYSDSSFALSTSASALDVNRAVEQQQPQQPVGFTTTTNNTTTTPSATSNLAGISPAVPAVEGDGSAFGFTAWATRTPPSIDDEDITDEKLMSMMRAERLAWSSASQSQVGPLMPPTPTPPQLGENTPIAWEAWTAREIPRYAPPPLLPVMPDGDATPSVNNLASSGARRAPVSPASSSSPAPPPPQPRSEADLYFACPFWEPAVPDAQMLLEQGKMTQAARLMRRLQREHHRANDGSSSQKKTAANGADDEEEADEDGDADGAWGMGTASFYGDNSTSTSSPSSPAGARGKKGANAEGSGSPDTLQVLREMQQANGTGTGGSWTAGGLLSAEQRAQSGGGWAPAPMHGPFVFDISSTEKRRSADGQRWCFKVQQKEINSFQ